MIIKQSLCVVKIAAVGVLVLLIPVKAFPDAPISYPINQLTVLDSNSVTQKNQNFAGYDFGTKLVAPTKISHIFTINNDTTSDVVIDRLDSSCPCTSAKIVDAHNNYVIPAKQSIDVAVIVDLSHLSPGKILKTVTVLEKGKNTPVAVLSITGFLIQTVSFSPREIDFNQIPFGQGGVRLLKATVTASIASTKQVPVLISSNSDVTLNPVRPGRTLIPTPDLAPALKDHYFQFEQYYEVKLAPSAQLGKSQIRLSIKNAPDAFSENIYVPVTADIVGDITASKTIVGYGALPSGMPASSTVIVTSSKSNKIEAFANSPYLSVSIKKMKQDAKNTEPLDATTQVSNRQQWTLKVVLKRSTPAGAFHAEVSVRSDDGERLILPVFAYLTVPLKSDNQVQPISSQ